MNDIPQYSVDAREVLDYFYQDYVAAIFYFEDANHEAVYERLLTKLIPGLKPFQVICLGGKTKLIAKSKEVRPAGARWIFILDKDYDDLLGTVFAGKGVYYLQSFSIENYLVDWASIAKVAIEVKVRELTFALARQRCGNFPAYLGRLQHRLTEIARLFVVARRYRVGIETTKIGVDDLLVGADADEPVPTEEWVIDCRARIRQMAHGANEWLGDEVALQAAIDAAFERGAEVTFPLVEQSSHLCGKHLLGCVVRYLQRVLDVGLVELDAIEFYIRIIGHASLVKMDYLRNAIVRDNPDLVSVNA